MVHVRILTRPERSQKEAADSPDSKNTSGIQLAVIPLSALRPIAILGWPASTCMWTAYTRDVFDPMSGRRRDANNVSSPGELREATPHNSIASYKTWTKIRVSLKSGCHRMSTGARRDRSKSTDVDG